MDLGDALAGAYECGSGFVKLTGEVRPLVHHERESIDAPFTARRYRTIQIDVSGHTITAAGPLPDDLAEALNAVKAASSPVH